MILTSNISSLMLYMHFVSLQIRCQSESTKSQQVFLHKWHHVTSHMVSFIIAYQFSIWHAGLTALGDAHFSSFHCKVNNEYSTLFSPFSSFVSENCEYAHIAQWPFKYKHFALFCGNFICSKVKPQKERWIRLCHINKLAARWVK